MRFSNIKKWVGGALATVLLVGSLAGCDSDADTSVTTTADVVETETAVETQIDAATADSADPAASSGDDRDDHLAGLPLETLSEQETIDIVHMREEEKLARDVYLVMSDLWGVRVFSNIAESEQRHMDEVLDLIDRYELEDPVGSNEVGVFTNPDLQALYDSLIEQGSVSLNDALIVGASIEDLDIFDLHAAIAGTDNEDVALIWGNLLSGSNNHMRAFTKQLDRNNVDFTPSYITVAEYEEIISTPSGIGNG